MLWNFVHIFRHCVLCPATVAYCHFPRSGCTVFLATINPLYVFHSLLQTLCVHNLFSPLPLIIQFQYLGKAFMFALTCIRLFLISLWELWFLKFLFASVFERYLVVFFLWRRQWQPTPLLLPGKSHGERSLVGCSPWSRWESDTTEWLHFHFSLSCIGEGNGNPLQCSCLEKPRDGGAWWAAVYGVAQSRTRLKRLSSSSSGILHIK